MISSTKVMFIMVGRQVAIPLKTTTTRRAMKAMAKRVATSTTWNKASFSSTTSIAATAPDDDPRTRMSTMREQILQQSMENIKQYGIHDATAIENATLQVLEKQQRPQTSLAMIGMITVPQLIQYTIQHCNVKMYELLSTSTNGSTTASPPPHNEVGLAVTSGLSLHPSDSNNSSNNNRDQMLRHARTQTIQWCIQQRIRSIHDITTTTHHASFLARSVQWDCLGTTHWQLRSLIQNIVLPTTTTTDPPSSHDHHHHHVPPENATISSTTTTNATLTIATTFEEMTLGAIYIATELHFLSDTSPDHEVTWTFLESQLVLWEQYCSNQGSNHSTTHSHSDMFSTASSLLSTSLSSSSSLLQILQKIPAALQSSPSQSIHKVLQYHTPSDMAFTMNIFGSAIASGLASLLIPPPPSAVRSKESIHASFPSTTVLPTAVPPQSQ